MKDNHSFLELLPPAAAPEYHWLLAALFFLFGLDGPDLTDGF